MRIQDHFSISVNLDVGCGRRRVSVCMLVVGIGVCLSAARRFVSHSDTVVYIQSCAQRIHLILLPRDAVPNSY